MGQLRISDKNPTMVAKKSFENILEQIQSSNLNFQLQLSPFSANISLKKSFIKDKSGNLLLPQNAGCKQKDQEVGHHNSQLESENDHLREQIQELQIAQKSSQETIEILEQKISKIEASALKAFDERNIDTTVLKNSLKTANIDLEHFKKDVRAQNKCIKEKEKEIYKLEQKSENLADNLQKSKTKISSLESENSEI
jgi:chromosome segregation ATPase